MRRSRSALWLALLAQVALVGLPACTDGWGKRKLPPEPEAQPLPEHDPILAETIGARTLMAGVEPTRLRGFGLVINLGEHGGADCPTTIRDYLIEFFSKEFMADEGQRGRTRLSPRRLIDSLDTAVVEVQALIPAGSPAGTPVDVQIEAIGAQTTSLEGGLLLPCELKIFDVAASGQGLIAGRALARAHGAVFTNPFSDDEGGDPIVAKRRGFVLGGGVTLENRHVRLLLEEPSYSVSRRIENQINERFGQQPPAAEAVSRGFLQLLTPIEFADEPEHYVDLVTHLHVDNVPGQLERRLQWLDELLSRHRRLDDISLIWEGIGSKAIPTIRTHYDSDDAGIRYAAARAGLRLADTSAIAVMGGIAATPDDPRRIPAIHELGRMPNPRIMPYLSKLLNDDNQQVRIAAYEGLLKHQSPAIESHSFAVAGDPTQKSFTLDVVNSTGRPLVFVKRSGEARIAVFNPKTPVSLPMFYEHPDAWVTLNARDDSSDIAIFCQTRHSGQFSEPLHVPPLVVDLIRGLGALPVPNENGHIPGIGLPFSTLVQVCDALQRDGTIPAMLVMETTTIPDLLGPSERAERPETADRGAPLPPRDEASSDADMLKMPPEAEDDLSGARPE